MEGAVGLVMETWIWTLDVRMGGMGGGGGGVVLPAC